MSYGYHVLSEVLSELRIERGLETITGYYPGADTDYGPLEMLASLHEARRMIYTDYWTGKDTARHVLHRQYGRGLVGEVELEPADLGIDAWRACWHEACGRRMRKEAASAYGIRVRSVHHEVRAGDPGLVWKPSRGAAPHGESANAPDGPEAEVRYWDPYEEQWRGTSRDDAATLDAASARATAMAAPPGPGTFDAVFLGTEGIGTYGVLVRAGWRPNFVVLQDHGLGGNWNSFGAGGLLEASARQLAALPELLLVAENTRPWEGYTQISDGCAYPGQLHTHRRAVFLRTDLLEAIARAGRTIIPEERDW